MTRFELYDGPKYDSDLHNILYQATRINLTTLTLMSQSSYVRKQVDMNVGIEREFYFVCIFLRGKNESFFFHSPHDYLYGYFFISHFQI